jgi:hypothetical protein
MKAIAWNIGHRDEPWQHLLDSGADIALLSEASLPPDDVAEKLEIDPGPWRTAGSGRWKAALVKLSDEVEVQWLQPNSLADATPNEFAVSREGTMAAAIVTPREGEPIIFVSMYAVWERPNATTKRSWIYADASVHRLISDLSAFVSNQTGHRIIAAGDLNILHGYGEHGSKYWASRYDTVFERMDALGLSFVGPQASADSRQADPWPDELPRESANVPTFHTNRQVPATATRQLDFTFASHRLAKGVRVRAMNDPDQWGPSDHCRIEIEVKC